MHACSAADMLSSPEILGLLGQAGADVYEVDDHRWNCLFKCVGTASNPWRSNEFEALRYLLTVFDNVFARDCRGRTIFDLLAGDSMYGQQSLGSYKQDLWYCALYRSQLPRRFTIPPPPPGPAFDSRYTIEHYRAMLYHESWDLGHQSGSPANLPLTVDNAPSERDWDTIPTVRGWNPSDLLMMEERLSQATYDFREYSDDEELA